MNDQQELEREILARARQINRLSGELEDLILSFREIVDTYRVWNNSNTINTDLDDIYVPCVRGTRHGRKFEISLTSRQIGEGGIAFKELDGTSHSMVPRLLDPGSSLEEKPIEASQNHKNRTSYKFLDTWGSAI